MKFLMSLMLLSAEAVLPQTPCATADAYQTIGKQGNKKKDEKR